MVLAHELDVSDLALLKNTLGQLQMIGRFGYKQESEMFVDIMKGFRILQNMAEYIAEKISGLEINMKDKYDLVDDNDSGETKVEMNEDDDIDINDLSSDIQLDESVKEAKMLHLDEVTKTEIFALTDKTVLTASGDYDYTIDVDTVSDQGAGTRMKRRKRADRREKVSCPFCAKQISKGNLSHHTKTHSSTNRFCCDLCDKRFIRSNQFSNHMENTHGRAIIKGEDKNK